LHRHEAFVSIHARVKRATPGQCLCVNGALVSIHARVKRATGIVKQDFADFAGFNPRPREAGDA